MAATGTIALNANSLSVTGSGTKFTTEAQVGGALVTYIGNVPYTFVIDSIESDTALNLTTIYQGSNVTGQSFSLLDRGAYTGVNAELGTRTAQAVRGLNYDKANWQQILTVDGNVTVNVPDGSQYKGPSWLSLSKSLSSIGSSISTISKSISSIVNSLSSKPDKNDVLLKTNNTIIRSGNNSVIRVSDGIYKMDFISGAGLAVGAYNPQTVGGITFYTHFYKVTLPATLPNGVIAGVVTLGGDRFGNQNPGYNADVKLCRDNDAGNGLLTSYVTISLKTPQTGWIPYFQISLVGY